jgi:hypothetical protein
MADTRTVTVTLKADTSAYLRGMRKAARATQRVNRMRAGKLSRGWYWVFGLYGLSISLFILAAAIKVITA